MRTRKPSLNPSFFGRGVPEYPANKYLPCCLTASSYRTSRVFSEERAGIAPSHAFTGTRTSTSSYSRPSIPVRQPLFFGGSIEALGALATNAAFYSINPS